MKKTFNFALIFLISSTVYAQFDAQLFQTFPNFNDDAVSLKFSPDGNFFAVGCEDHVARIFHKTNDGFRNSQNINDHTDIIYSVCFSPDGNYLATGSGDKTIKIYQYAGGNFFLKQTLSGHSDRILSICFSADSKYLAYGTKYQIGIYKNTSSAFKFIKSINSSDWVSEITFSKDGNFLAANYDDKTVKIYKIQNENFTLIKNLNFTKKILCITFSPNSHFFAVGRADKNAVIYNVDGNNFEITKTIGNLNGRVNSISFSPDSKYLSLGTFNEINFYKTDSGFPKVKTLLEPEFNIWSIDFDCNGDFFIQSSYDKVVRIYKLNGVEEQEINKNDISHNNNNNNVVEENIENNPTGLPPILSLSKIEVSEPILRAEKTITIDITVNNIGMGAANGVYAILSTNMDFALSYKNKTFFKTIPNTDGTQTISIPITAKENIPSSQLQVDIKIIEPNFNMQIQGKRVLITTEKLKEPELTFARFSPKEIISNSPNNKIDINEQIGFDIFVQNIGMGEADNVKIEVSNTQNGVMFLGYSLDNGAPSNTKPMFKTIKPGEFVFITAQYFINTSFVDDKIELTIKITDIKGKYGFTQTRTTPVNSVLSSQGKVVTIDTTNRNNNNNAKIIVQNLPEQATNLIVDLQQNPLKSNRYALIIGNEKYNDLVAVDYALNDARDFKVYAKKILGIPEDNIIYIENAGVINFNNLLKKASNLMNENRELFVYYSGHGFPTENGETYLMPIDVNEDNVEEYGIKLYDFYQILTINNPKRVTVFIDACFSGGGRNGLSIARTALKRTSKTPEMSNKIISFTASSEDEVAQKYDDQTHGLFTYYLLKILKDTNGDITYGEFSTLIQNEVKDRSNKITNLKEQNPKTNISSEVNDWKNWSFK